MIHYLETGSVMRPRIFIGCATENIEMATAIQRNLQFEALCITWPQALIGISSTTVDELLKAVGNADYAIFVFAPNDIVKIREHEKVQPRDNVLFECGMFMGRLGRRKVFLVAPRNVPDLHTATDLLGIIATTYEPKDLVANVYAALGPACSDIMNAIKEAEFSKPAPKHPSLRSRKELISFESWTAAKEAKDILLIGQNLGTVSKFWPFFKEKLEGGASVRCLVADFRDKALISAMERGVVEHGFTRTDFVASLKTFIFLRSSIGGPPKLEVKLMDYVPNVSFVVVGGETGTMIVEPNLNRAIVQDRPHFVLSAASPADRVWYEAILKNCEQMYADGSKWDWSLPD